MYFFIFASCEPLMVFFIRGGLSGNHVNFNNRGVIDVLSDILNEFRFDILYM